MLVVLCMIDEEIQHLKEELESLREENMRMKNILSEIATLHNDGVSFVSMVIIRRLRNLLTEAGFTLRTPKGPQKH